MRLDGVAADAPAQSTAAPGQAVGALAARAALWAVGLQAGIVGASVLGKLVTARLLSPEEFGLMGVCLLAFGTIEVMSQTGLVAALIHERSLDREQLDTTFAVSIVRGVLLAGALMLCAGPVAAFFDVPGVAGPMRLLAIVFVLDGLANPGMVLFRRDLAFARIAGHQASGAVIDLAVGIALALALRNVYALVFATVARYATLCLVSHVLSPYRPRPRIDARVFRRLFRFGRWVAGANFMAYLLNQGDNAVVGKLLGAQALGLYGMAFTLSNLPATAVTNVLGEVAYPAYVRVRDGGGCVGEAYLRLLRSVTYLSVPLAGGVFVLAPTAVPLALGPAWEPAVPTVQILAFWGLLRSIGANSGPLFQALGRPDLWAKTSAARLVMTAALIVPMTARWGTAGAAGAVLGAAVLQAPVTWGLSIRVSRCGVRPFLGALVLPCAATTLAAGTLLALGPALPGFSSAPWLALQVLIGGAVYLGAGAALSRLGAGEGAAPVLEGMRSLVSGRRLGAAASGG